MCVYSLVADQWDKMWLPNDPRPTNPAPPAWVPAQPYNGPTKEQFEELLKLLRAAKIFDEKTNQPECEDKAKKAKLKKQAKKLGVQFPKDL